MSVYIIKILVNPADHADIIVYDMLWWDNNTGDRDNVKVCVT